MSEQEGGDERAAVLRDLQIRIDEGFTFEAFITSDVGRFLCARADRERESLIEALILCDPDNLLENRRLRARIAVLDTWQQWIADAITDGRSAQQQFVDNT